MITAVSLSLIHTLILLNQNCVWTGTSVWAAVSAVVDAEKSRGFLPDRYHCSLVELAGLKCCSCTKSHATAGLFATLEVLQLAVIPQELPLQLWGGVLAATAPDSTQVPSAAAGPWWLSAPPILAQFRKSLCPPHYRILLPTVQAPELLTSATQHCMTLQKLLTNLYWFVRRLHINTITLLNYFFPLQ